MLINIPDTFSIWLVHYGSFALFALVTLGFVVLPVPQDVLLIFAGVLMSRGKLGILPAFSAAFLGTFLAVTVTYLVGRFLELFLYQYGRYIGITKMRLEKFNHWYERYGKWTLLIGYYIPLIRRIFGYGAGLAKLNFKEFIVLTFIGSFIWVTLFLAIGYFIGYFGTAVLVKS